MIFTFKPSDFRTMWECKVVWNKWLVWMCECEWLPGYGVGARCRSAGVNWYHTLHIINWSWPPPQATNFTIISSRIVFLFKHCMMQALSSIEILRTEGTNVNNSKLWEIFNFLTTYDLTLIINIEAGLHGSCFRRNLYLEIP